MALVAGEAPRWLEDLDVGRLRAQVPWLLAMALVGAVNPTTWRLGGKAMHPSWTEVQLGTYCQAQGSCEGVESLERPTWRSLIQLLFHLAAARA